MKLLSILMSTDDRFRARAFADAVYARGLRKTPIGEHDIPFHRPHGPYEFHHGVFYTSNEPPCTDNYPLVKLAKEHNLDVRTLRSLYPTKQYENPT